jgi:CubicO group peptidase (beta-lactamase class C family)
LNRYEQETGGFTPPFRKALAARLAALAAVVLACAGADVRTSERAVPADRYAAAASAARQALRSRLERDRIPALSAAVAVDGRVVWAEAMGVADLDRRVAATEHTLFGIGSVTKSLTMALAGRLVDQGRLDLDAPVERYLPDFPHAGKGITTRLVAAHLSGLDDRFATANRLTARHHTTREALAEIYKEPLRAAPGSEHFYGTGTYTVIAGVIEKAGGEPFADALRHRVLEPLGMTSTVPNDPHSPASARATFYEADARGRPVRAPAYDPSHKLAGAGYLSTASDLVRFGSALARPGFLKEATLEQIFTPMRTSDGTDTGVGLGWRIGADAYPGMGWTIGPDTEKRRIVHQPGGGPGISCWLVVDRDAGLAAAVLSNLTSANVGGAAFDAMLEAFLRARGQGAGAGTRDSVLGPKETS